MDTYTPGFESNVNYKKLVQRFLNFKNLYITTIVILVISVFIYNRSATVQYSNKTTVMISDKEQNVLGGGQDFLQGMAMLSGKSNIDNEMEIIKSFSLIKEALDRMDIKTTIYSYKRSIFAGLLEKVGLHKVTELYENSPVRIVVDQTHDQATYLPFYIKFLDDNTFEITTKSKDDNVYLYNYIDDQIKSVKPYKFFNYRYSYGQEIKTEYCSFKILKTESFNKDFTKDNALFFYLDNINYLTFDYQDRMKVAPVTETSSIIQITLKGSNYYRVTDFLNALTSVFLDHNLQKKNNAAASTVSFIDAQISEFKDSLSTAENSLKNFRTSHQVMDLSFQGQQVFSKLEELETQSATLKEQLRYYVYLKDYFNKNRDADNLVAPASMKVVDPILGNLVTELITASSERSNLIGNNQNSDNILLKNYNVKIENLKKTIVENLENSITNTKASISELDYRISKISGQISSMPKTELQLKGIERKFQLNSTIYTFLLQKRSEAQIVKASSMPDYEIVEPARAISPSPVSPKKSLNLIIALFLGLLLPTLYILIIDFFNNRLNDIEEIEAMANKPVLGKVFHNFRKISLIVAQRPNSSVTESFRSVRTNFQFFDHSGKKQVVLLTSSASGDGKTFCSINFASTLALNGHKTVLLEFDLRRPKIHQEFGASNMIGISSFLIDKAVIEDIILPTEIENLDLISAGPAAPNPAELIASERTTEFLETLKGMYDYIVIDSAPVGIVSETFLLMKYSDVNIFVVRLEYTVRDAFKNALKGMQNNGFTNFSLLINDLNIRKESYKYGYDTKYYSQDEPGFFGRLFRRNKSA
jgi:tyrosine-protein kinase Etk/Wzc